MIRIIFPLLLGIATLLGGTAAAQQPIEIADDAPDSYTVVRGDTLWDISARFLKQPWRWPEVWRMNREQIRNPHLIYPGQIIVLDRSGPWLSVGRRIGTGDGKLQPQVYSEPALQPIPSIPLEIIEPFLTAPLVVDEATLAGSATVVANDGSRVYAGGGDTVFAKDVRPGVERWEVYRRAEALVDPLTREVLGYEARHLGTARITEAGDPATLHLVRAHEEIGAGDRLLPAELPRVFSYVPRPPAGEVHGRIIGIHRGVEVAGTHQVVILNTGSRDGLESGNVLALWRNRGSVEHERERIALPDQRYGLAFVFRVFDRVSYALVVNSNGQVTVGDGVRQP
ncbi:LysM peptidoglycan-binding domain-containing protein [Pseudothauera nasutitermitis]|uniref:LysM peptidoglycan-binding domain-containing protein n=1 Tax=Pseudothauera nasutitermitis TaxID=2565930 RepID=A0A4S4AWW1_9RHOO|nr:LysM domain-containing protein [Pseudothauera nasutitermitis]THF64545.1 LysM peptidoglycan-binding domain-containing protein [Pseudothauera nasutitermitis]